MWGLQWGCGCGCGCGDREIGEDMKSGVAVVGDLQLARQALNLSNQIGVGVKCVVCCVVFVVVVVVVAHATN